jgi:O-antigen/teichoic acid export membrane protein
MNRLAKIYSSNEMLRNVITLMTGSAVSLALPVMVSPILTRLYDPGQFGALAVFMASCSLLGVFATGRYDLAIIEPKIEDEAKDIVRISIFIAIAFVFVLIVLLILFYPVFQDKIQQKGLGNWVFAIPLTVFMLACYSVIGYWMNRKKDFKGMGLNRVLNNGTNAVVSVLCGKLGWGSGLFVGFLAGQVIATGVLQRKIKYFLFNIDLQSLRATAAKYKQYPTFLMPASLAYEISSQAPMILLTMGFGSESAGFLALANRVAAAPVALFGNTIGEVYRQKAFEDRHQIGNCRSLYIRTLGLLALIGFFPSILLLIFGPWLFRNVFGSEWEQAGQVGAAISPMLFFNFLSSPLSYTIVFNNSQRIEMVLQILRMLLSISAIGFGWLLSDYMLGVFIYSLVHSLYYIAHSVVQYKASL